MGSSVQNQETVIMGLKIFSLCFTALAEVILYILVLWAVCPQQITALISMNEAIYASDSVLVCPEDADLEGIVSSQSSLLM